MTNFIPIFPLEIVVFPGEQLNLHIFEPRYKQLITECVQQKKPFGIPVVIDKKIQDFGCLLHVKEITRSYDTGEMDVKTTGEKVFRILEIIQEIPEKLYSGAIVNYPDNQFIGKPQVMKLLLQRMEEMHKSLQVKMKLSVSEDTISAYDIAHHSGLSLHQEYEFLQLLHEQHRQEYLKRHFEEVVPKVKEVQKLKEKIQMNGHFRELQSPF